MSYPSVPSAIVPLAVAKYRATTCSTIIKRHEKSTSVSIGMRTAAILSRHPSQFRRIVQRSILVVLLRVLPRGSPAHARASTFPYFDCSIFRYFDISIFRYFDSSIFRYFEPMQLARDLDSSSIHAEIIIDLLMHPPFQEAFDLRLISKLNQIYVCTTVEYNFICCAKQQRYDHITIAFLANFKNVSYIGSINSFRCIQIDK